METAFNKPRRVSALEKLRDSHRRSWLSRRLRELPAEEQQLAELEGGNVLAVEFDPRHLRVTAIIHSARYPQRRCRYLSFRLPADDRIVREQAMRLRDSYGFPVTDEVIEQMLAWTHAISAKLVAAARR